MVAHAFATFGAIVLASVFFAVPLILKYHVYKPEVKHVATGDVFEVHGPISSTWCQSVELSSDASFQSFLFDFQPQVNESDVERTVTYSQVTLPNRGQKVWNFHFLRGTIVNISACVRLFGGDLTVVKGHKALRRCIAERRRVLEMGNDLIGEESESESESDDVTSSISSSQGAISNETDRMYQCEDALYHVKLPHAYNCRANVKPYSSQKEVLFQFIEHTDHYYYIVSSDTYLDIIPNEFYVQFTTDRTHYDYTTNSGNCSSSELCTLDIDLASDQTIVAQLDGVNGLLKTEKVTITCKPREWIFLIFYAAFFLVIFLCAFQ